MNYNKIPKSIWIGGTEIKVLPVERCNDNCLGTCCVARGEIEIADKINKDEEQSPSSKINTFYHELIHGILETMGEKELNENERFVCSFSSFLTEAMKNAYFEGYT